MSRDKKSKPRLEPGTQIGPYQCGALIGKGGMGEVYEAQDLSLNRKVALKVIPERYVEDDEDDEMVKRFESEGKALAQLHHPNVVLVYSLGQQDKIHYIAMEFVDGKSLKEIVNKKAFSVEQAIPLFLQVLDGVRALHNSNIIHRDLKPANVIYRNDQTIKIVDLGVAKMTQHTDPNLTKVGEIVGSPMYMSPEVALGMLANEQSDIWGLGVIFFEMLTGTPPFEGKSQAAILKKVLAANLKFPKEVQARTPEWVVKVIKKMCERERTLRYKSSTEVINDIEQYTRGVRPKEETKTDVFSGNEKNIAVLVNTTVPQNNMEAARASTRVRSYASTNGQSRTRSKSSRSGSSEFAGSPGYPHHRTRAGTSSQRNSGGSKKGLYIGSLSLIGIMFIVGLYILKGHESADLSSQGGIESPLVEVEINDIKIEFPKNNEIIWQKDSKSPVYFRWQGLKLGAAYTIQIAYDEAFEDLIVNSAAPTSPFMVSTLRAEEYFYWRIALKSPDKPLRTTKSMKFFTSLKAAPIPISPKSGQRIEIDEESAIVRPKFEWKPKVTAAFYNLQIARDIKFKNLIYDKKTSNTRVFELALPPENYYWRVRVGNDTVLTQYWSQVVEFEVFQLRTKEPVERIKPSALKETPTGTVVNIPAQPLIVKKTAPQQNISKGPKSKSKSKSKRVAVKQLARTILKSERVQTTLNLKEKTYRGPASWLPRSYPSISWNKVSRASGYDVEIARDKQFKDIIDRDKTEATFYQWKRVIPGEYYFRVSARGAGFSSGRYSRVGRISAKVPSPELPLKIPGNGTGVSVQNDGIRISLSWNRVPAAAGYFIQASKDSRFRDSKTYYSTNEKIDFTLAKAEKYFIRMAALNKDKNKISQYSKTSQVAIETPLHLLSPTLIDPVDGAGIVVFQGRASPVVFRWEKVRGASEYLIQFSFNPQFEDIFFRDMVASESFVLEKKFPNGKVYWRLRAQKGNSISPWTKIRYLEISKSN